MTIEITNSELYEAINNVDLSLAVSDGSLIFGKVTVNLKDGNPDVYIGQIWPECFETKYGFVILKS